MIDFFTTLRGGYLSRDVKGGRPQTGSAARLFFILRSSRWAFTVTVRVTSETRTGDASENTCVRQLNKINDRDSFRH